VSLYADPLKERGLLLVSHGHISDNGCISLASRDAGVKMEPVKVAKMIGGEKREISSCH
jgi:hypothetical protein